jgi:hypothetical protein
MPTVSRRFATLRRLLLLLSLASFSAVLSSCASPETEDPGLDATSPDPEATTGQLAIAANGEDFVREGFTSKDGWAITFDQVNVSLGEVVPLQGEVPGEAIAPQMVDLAAGDETAEPIALGTVTVPSGHYNGVQWSFAPSEDQPSLTLVGTATKDDRTLNFNLAFAPDTAYTCGEYIGDVRKGFVEPDAPGDLEITLHFDHIFGDAGVPASEEINTKGFGFDRFAAIAAGDTITVTPETLSEQLSPEEVTQLEALIAGLGHVGEGHCEPVETSAAAI